MSTYSCGRTNITQVYPEDKQLTINRTPLGDQDLSIFRLKLLPLIFMLSLEIVSLRHWRSMKTNVNFL